MYTYRRADGGAATERNDANFSSESKISVNFAVNDGKRKERNVFLWKLSPQQTSTATYMKY